MPPKPVHQPDFCPQIRVTRPLTVHTGTFTTVLASQPYSKRPSPSGWGSDLDGWRLAGCLDGFLCSEVDTSGAEVGHFFALDGGTVEHVLSPCDLESFEPGGHDRGLERCFQQRSRYSVGPQVNVAFGTLGNLFFHCDVSDLDTATRSQDPEDLVEHPVLVR